MDGSTAGSSEQGLPLYTDDRLLEETKARAKDLLSCQLCFQTFRDARTLPCSHAFCLRCLQRLCTALQASNPIAKLGSFGCPTCRKPIGLPRGGVAEFPADTRVNQIRDRAVDEIMRKIAQQRSGARNTADDINVSADDSARIDSGIDEDLKNYSSSTGKAYPGDSSNLGRFGSSFTRHRPAYSSMREPGIAAGSKAASVAARLGRSSSFNTTSSAVDATKQKTEAAASFTPDAKDVRDFVRPVIGRNRSASAILRERRRRTIYAEDRPSASFLGMGDAVEYDSMIGGGTNGYPSRRSKDAYFDQSNEKVDVNDLGKAGDGSLPNRTRYDYDLDYKSHSSSNSPSRVNEYDVLKHSVRSEGRSQTFMPGSVRDSKAENHFAGVGSESRSGLTEDRRSEIVERLLARRGAGLPRSSSFKDSTDLRRPEHRGGSEENDATSRLNSNTFAARNSYKDQNGSVSSANTERLDLVDGSRRESNDTGMSSTSDSFSPYNRFLSTLNRQHSTAAEAHGGNDGKRQETVKSNIQSSLENSFAADVSNTTNLPMMVMEEDISRSSRNSAGESKATGESQENTEGEWRVLEDNTDESSSNQTQVNDVGIDAISRQKPTRMAFRRFRSKRRSLSVTSPTQSRKNCEQDLESSHSELSADECVSSSQVTTNGQTSIGPNDVTSQNVVSDQDRKNVVSSGADEWVAGEAYVFQCASDKCDTNVPHSLVVEKANSIVEKDRIENLEASVDKTKNKRNESSVEPVKHSSEEIQSSREEVKENEEDDEEVISVVYHSEINYLEVNRPTFANNSFIRTPSAEDYLKTSTTSEDKNSELDSKCFHSAESSNRTDDNINRFVHPTTEKQTSDCTTQYDSTNENSSPPKTDSKNKSHVAFVESHHRSKTSSKKNRNTIQDFSNIPNEGSALLNTVSSHEFVMPTAVAMLRHGCTVVADYGKASLQYTYSDGSPSHVIDSLKPFSLVVDSTNDHVIVGDRKHKTVSIFDEYGSDVAQWDANLFGWICGLGILRNGNLAVLDRARSKIGVYTASGRFVSEFGSYGSADNQLCMGEFLTIDSRNRIITCDSGNHCIKVFSPDGGLLGKFGGGRGDSGEGELQWPKGVCIDSRDNIIVADTCNNRVSMFSSCGQFVEHLVTNVRLPYALHYKHTDNVLAVTTYAVNAPTQYRLYNLAM